MGVYSYLGKGPGRLYCHIKAAGHFNYCPWEVNMTNISEVHTAILILHLTSLEMACTQILMTSPLFTFDHIFFFLIFFLWINIASVIQNIYWHLLMENII